MSETICPECKTKINVNENRTYPGIDLDFIERFHQGHTSPEKWIDESSIVLCPNCGVEFSCNAIRYLGVFSPKGFKIFLGLFVFGFLSFVIYLLIESIMKF